MNKQFWNEHYKEHTFKEHSTFAEFCLPYVEGTLVDIGCGDGRDLYYFKNHGIDAHGVDASNEDVLIVKQDIMAYIRENRAPDNVYARFFWHAITRDEQLALLKWTKKRLFIEARTTLDKPKNLFGKHQRKLVKEKRLKQDLEDHRFTIQFMNSGYGLSTYLGEDPHLVRVIAEK